jgi:ADP-ribosylglycohydrolase
MAEITNNTGITNNSEINKGELLDYIQGCLLGGWVGDAAGASLEFYSGLITDDDVTWAMSMPGGGKLSIGPGQVTDDSELEIALLHALMKQNPPTGYPILDVMDRYLEWAESEPFDIGMTCLRAFNKLENDGDTIENAKKHNLTSEANGALMRAAAIAVWGRGHYVYPFLKKYAILDSLMSHPHKNCRECNGLYVIAIAYLLNNWRDSIESKAQGALHLIETYVDPDNKTVQSWIEQSKDITELNIYNNGGWVRYAFTLAVYFLRNPAISYEEAIRITLKKGADTDTNAKIVGSMMGALHGVRSIPEYMSKPVLSFKCEEWDYDNPPDRKYIHTGYNRPATYNVRNMYDLLHVFV